MPRYEIAFVDGKTVVKDGVNGDDAKRAAKKARSAELPEDTPKSAPEVKVARVTQLD